MTSTFKKIFENAMNNVLKEADENFVSVSDSADDFDVTKGDIETEALPEDKQEEKNKLTAQAIEKIKDSLKVSDELQSILNQIKKINDDTDYNEWKANEEDNTAVLKSKNAKIFKQNNNLCLSHNGEIELFKSVPELHEWLKKNNYPLPHNIKLHESTMLIEGFGDIIPTDEIIIPHTNKSQLFRMQLAYQDSPWANILKHRWENAGTSRGKILGYAIGLNDSPKTSEPNIQEIKLDDGRKVYLDTNKIDTDTNKAVPVYSTPDLKIKAGAYRPDDESITALDVNDNSQIDPNEFYNTHHDVVKMGRDATKAAMSQAGYKQIASQTKPIRDTNLGAFNSPEYSKIIDKVGLDRAEDYIGDVSKDGTQCLDINGELVGIVKDKKVYDKNHPDIKIGKVGLNGYCFKENNINEDQIDNVWYLRYENSDLEQNYLNNNWKVENLLTDTLDSAAKFISREDAINELKTLYNIKTTPFPFKPVMIDNMEECGCACGVTSAGLGTAVQYVGNSKKKEESLKEDEDLDEAKRDAYSQGRSDIHKNYLIGAPVYNKLGEIIGHVTDRATARNDISLSPNDETSIIINDNGDIIGKGTKEKHLAKTLDGNTLGFEDGGKVYTTNNHIVGNVKDNIVYDSKKHKLGTVTDEIIQIVTNNQNYPIGYVDTGEAFSFTDEKIGDVQDSEDFEGGNVSERNYVVQNSEGQDIGYTTLQGHVRNFNGNYIGNVDMADQAQKAGANYDDLSDIIKNRKTQGAQSDFTAYAIGKKPFSPYNKKGELKPDYIDTINPGTYTSENLFGQLFDLNSQEINALLVDKDTFINRINAINKMHGVNFDPEQPIYPRSAAKGTSNQQAWDTLQQNFMNDVALKKGRRGINAMTNTDKETWNNQVTNKINNPENAENLINKSKDILNKALADYDEGKVSTAYSTILNHLQSIKNNENIPTAIKNSIYNEFMNSGIDGVPEMINLMFSQKESVNEDVLTEDDPTPADFADGGSQDVSLDDVTTSDTSTTQTSDNLDGLDDYGPEEPNSPASFGDINITNGAPDIDEENPAPIPQPNTKIIDVLADEKDMTKLKVKVKDLDTGKIEIKDLSEIDV